MTFFERATQAIVNNNIDTLSGIVLRDDFNINGVERETFIGKDGMICVRSELKSLLVISKFLMRDEISDFLIDNGAREIIKKVKKTKKVK